MAFLDNMDKKLSQLGQGAIKKTKDVSESVRLSGAIREEENKQVEIYKQIGEYFYQNYAEQADDQLKAWCDAVTRSKETVAQYKEHIRVLKGVTYCTNCNAEIPMNSVFCNNCGTRVVQAAPVQTAPVGPVCPSCHAPVTEGQLFCVNCGNRLPVQQEVQAAPVEETPAAEAPAEEWRSDIITESNVWETEEIPAESVNVWEAEAEVPVQEENWVEQTVEAAPGCPVCGSEVAPGQAFCTSCGTRL